jgi:Flp pilus assembly pilin Flp
MSGFMIKKSFACIRLARSAVNLISASRSESGQGVAEYIIILAVIVIACIILAIAFHEQLTNVWQSITDQIGAIA